MRHIPLLDCLDIYLKLASDNLTINLDGRVIDISNTSKEQLYNMYNQMYQKDKIEGKAIIDQVKDKDDNENVNKFISSYLHLFVEGGLVGNIYTPDHLLEVIRGGIVDENSGEALTIDRLKEATDQYFYHAFTHLVNYRNSVKVVKYMLGNGNEGRGKKVIGPGGEEFSKQYLGEIVREMVSDLVGVYGIMPVSIDIVFMTGIGGGKILVVGKDGDVYLNNNMGEYVTGKYFGKVSKRISNYGSYMIPGGWRLRVYP